jgi:hypothetical protein
MQHRNNFRGGGSIIVIIHEMSRTYRCRHGGDPAVSQYQRNALAALSLMMRWSARLLTSSMSPRRWTPPSGPGRAGYPSRPARMIRRDWRLAADQPRWAVAEIR